MIRQSLQARLLFAFFLIAAIASISGVVGSIFVSRTAGQIDQVMQEEVALKDKARVAELALMATLVELKSVLLTHQDLDAAETAVASAIETFSEASGRIEKTPL